MRQEPVPISSLGPERAAVLKRLTCAAPVGWLTVFTLCAMVAVYIGASWFAIVGAIPLWTALLANGVAGYWVFTVAHDGVHRSISSNIRFNDFLGQSALCLMGPYVSLKVFRWCHSHHHRFANSPKDPDRFMKGPWWSLPLRWLVIDFYYVYYIIRYGDKVSRPFLRSSFIILTFTVIAIALLTRAGYGVHVLMLWFIPSRIAFMLMGFSFFWLPHVPHDVSQEQNFTRASTLRVGHDRLMAFLLQFHHLHLIHHLYPSTPSFNNGKVWHLIEPELRRCDLAIQHGFAIRPQIHLATKEA